MWIDECSFPDLIKQWWQEIKVEGCAGFKLAIKFKLLKYKIREAKHNFGD